MDKKILKQKIITEKKKEKIYSYLKLDWKINNNYYNKRNINISTKKLRKTYFVELLNIKGKKVNNWLKFEKYQNDNRKKHMKQKFDA